jgi:SH3 domain protein
MLCAPEMTDAATKYIKDIKISVRSSQEMTGDNIVTFVQTGLEVTELKTEGSWSYIRIPNGREGWIRNQYLTTERPRYVAIETVEKECEKLVIQVDTLNEENKILKEENQRLRSVVEQAENKYAELDTAYETLKEDSQDVLKIRDDLKKAVSQRDDHRIKAEKLEKEMESVVNKEKYKMFLLGAGVLFAGIVIGSVLKRQKRKSFY